MSTNPAPARTVPSPDDVLTAIDAAIRKVRDPGPVSIEPGTRFDAVGLNSLELVTVVFELEDHFQIAIKTEYLDDFVTVGEARDVVLGLLAAQ